MASAEDMCDCCFPIDAPAKITRIEPKTFLANERTFLNWLSMSVTLGSVASALVAFGKTSSQQVPHSVHPTHFPCACVNGLRRSAVSPWAGRLLRPPHPYCRARC